MAERASTAHAASPSSANLPSDGKVKTRRPNLTVDDVYTMTARIAQEIQAVVNVYGTAVLQGLVELVVRTLEFLEHYVAETERLNTENCRIILELDQIMNEKKLNETLRSELKAMKLVSEERGRQRDALALRVGELEVTNQKVVRQVYELEKAHSKCSPHGSTHAVSPVSTRSLSVKQDGHHHYQEDTHQKELVHNQMLVKKLQSGIERERRQVADIIESKTLEQRRMERRLELAEEQLTKTKNDLAVAQQQIQKLQLEKKAMSERNQAMREISSRLLSFNTETSCLDVEEGEGEVAPRFFKKDLLMLLEERNKLKEELTLVREELDEIKMWSLATHKDHLSIRSRSAEKHWKKSRQRSVRNIFEDSMVTKHDGDTCGVTYRCRSYALDTCTVSQGESWKDNSPR